MLVVSVLIGLLVMIRVVSRRGRFCYGGCWVSLRVHDGVDRGYAGGDLRAVVVVLVGGGDGRQLWW